MAWKQPIPVDLEKRIFGNDHLSQLMFERLLIRARIEDKTCPDYWKKKIVLKRGQVVCGQEELGEWFGVNRKTIKNHLEKLQNEYGVVDNTYTSKGTIVTIKNFNSLVKMDSTMDSTKGTEVDSTGHIENVAVKPMKETQQRKVDSTFGTRVDTNKSKYKNNSKYIIPYVLGDLTPEQQRRKVEFV